MELFPLEKEFGEGKLKLDVVEGKIQFAVEYDGKDADAAITLELELIDLLRGLVAKTDNTIDDTVVDMVAKFLK